MIEDKKDTTLIKHPVVSECVAEFIESTRERELLDVVIEQEMRNISWKTQKIGGSKREKEINRFVLECTDTLLIARKFGYIVKEDGNE